MAQFAMKDGKERRGSYGNVEELLKRKRVEPELGKGEEDVLRSKKKSGLTKDTELGCIEEEGELQHLMKRKLENEELMN